MSADPTAEPVLPQQATPAPRHTYPRPDRDRSKRWSSLNGTWQLEIDDQQVEVVVPFAWETAASRVGRTWVERARYRRDVEVPADWAGRRTFLCFGAVHHRAEVLVDGTVVATHEGGYTSFEVDVTDHAAPGERFELVVDVTAPVDKREIPHGKQRSVPRDDYDGVSFTPTSGIWQDVWIEARARTYVEAVAVRGDSLTGLDLRGRLAGDVPAAPLTATVTRGSGAGESVRIAPEPDGSFSARLELADPRLWSPADPHLYAVTLTGSDHDGGPGEDVTVTAGLRSVAVVGDQIHLNGERLYVRGVLDQGYWPETGMTAPDERALLADLQLAKDLGFNLVRKHIKLEEPRWLHQADVTGMLVWAEPPGPSRWTPSGAAAFEAQLAPMVERDGNHPSIVIWGLYNEEWGLDWNIPGSPQRAAAAVSAYERMRALDTRPVVENSGWAHVRTDLVDWHYYDEDPAAWAANVAGLADGSRETFPVRLGPDYVVQKSLYADDEHPRSGVPLLNSEYGAGFTSLERGWHLRWQTQELRRHDRFAGYVYTELTDVEHEMAGLVDADRRPKDHGGVRAADVNAETVLVIDRVPRSAGADLAPLDGPVTLDVRVSHHGAETIEVEVRASWGTYGAPVPVVPPDGATVCDPLKVEPFRLSDPATVMVPPAPGPLGRIHLWVVTGAGAVLGRAFVDVAPVEPPNRP